MVSDSLGLLAWFSAHFTGLSPSLHPTMGSCIRAHKAQGSKVAARGALGIAQRPAPLRPRSAAIGVFSRCEVARAPCGRALL
jgi:hypothetical protein